MHGGSVLHIDAAERRHAFHNELFHTGTLRGVGLKGIVRIASEDPDAFHHGAPVPRDLDLDAAEDGVDLQYGRIAGHPSLPEVQFDTPKDSHHLAALEVLAGHDALGAPEDGVYFHGARTRPRHASARAHSY